MEIIVGMLVVVTIDLNLTIQCFYHTHIKKVSVGNLI